MSASQAAKKNLNQVYHRCSKIQYNLILKAPVILVPESSSSHWGLMVDLGKILLSNAIRLGSFKNELGHPNLLDQMNFCIQDV